LIAQLEWWPANNKPRGRDAGQSDDATVSGMEVQVQEAKNINAISCEDSAQF